MAATRPHGWVMRRGRAEHERKPALRIDLATMDAAVEMVLEAADALDFVARRLRIALRAPATDPVSLDLTGRFNNVRLAVGLQGDAAADELTRIAELVAAGAQNLADHGRRMPLAVMGLAAPPVSTVVVVAPAQNRRPPEAVPPYDLPSTDDEILSCAVLLTEGRPAPGRLVDEPFPALRPSADLLVQAATAVRCALSYGEHPERALVAFADWIRQYSDAVNTVFGAAEDWSLAYTAAREQLLPIAHQYASWLAAALSGNPRERIDAHAARAVIDAYRSVEIPASTLTEFPRLKTETDASSPEQG